MLESAHASTSSGNIYDVFHMRLNPCTDLLNFVTHIHTGGSNSTSTAASQHVLIRQILL